MQANELRDLLDYDPVSGVFTWRTSQGTQSYGNVAGSINKRGYIKIRIAGQSYMAHRLAWLYVHGAWPAGQVDHINRIKSDNRLENLRLADAQQNRANTTNWRFGKAGLRGVELKRGKFVAAIRVNGKRLHLGTFDTAEEASAAYQHARKQHFGEFPG